MGLPFSYLLQATSWLLNTRSLYRCFFSLNIYQAHFYQLFLEILMKPGAALQRPIVLAIATLFPALPFSLNRVHERDSRFLYVLKHQEQGPASLLELSRKLFHFPSCNQVGFGRRWSNLFTQCSFLLNEKKIHLYNNSLIAQGQNIVLGQRSQEH